MASKNPLLTPAPASAYDLWVIPTAEHSQWFAKLDWYLNWQMTKGLSYQRQKPSLELLRVMEMSDIAFGAHPEFGNTPLMVAANGRLETDRCVVIDYADDIKAWLGKAADVTKNLQAAKVRVYLPKGAAQSAARDHWKKLSDIEIEFSTDEDAT
jgi:hypothetical protein